MNTRVCAIIVQGQTLLLIHRVKGGREYWVFPGGGLEEADGSPENGLQRECLEELGVEVEVGLLFAEDVFDGPNEKQHQFFTKKTPNLF